ncbi:MAG: hypothetical protein IJ761_02455 [Bacteroidales bacterium]|nr:hypothetical protein [Bacteroidales bacterium]
MNTKRFSQIVERPTLFTSQDRGWLRAMSDKYPHSSIVNLMALVADCAYGFDTSERRREVEITLCNADHLKNMLENSRAIASKDEPKTDIFSEINSYQETSFKTAPKSVILTEFLQLTPTEVKAKTSIPTEETSFDGKKSVMPNEGIYTETLAVVLENQGKYAQALAIYRKLLTDNPSKISTFAPRIERLESLLKRN